MWFYAIFKIHVHIDIRFYIVVSCLSFSTLNQLVICLVLLPSKLDSEVLVVFVFMLILIGYIYVNDGRCFSISNNYHGKNTNFLSSFINVSQFFPTLISEDDYIESHINLSYYFKSNQLIKNLFKFQYYLIFGVDLLII